MMTTGLMKHFVNVWHTCEEYSILAHFLCPRNVLLLSQSKHAADKVWTCLAGFLVHLLSCDVLQPNSLEQQCVALLRSTWPQVNLICCWHGDFDTIFYWNLIKMIFKKFV